MSEARYFSTGFWIFVVSFVNILKGVAFLKMLVFVNKAQDGNGIHSSEWQIDKCCAYAMVTYSLASSDLFQFMITKK